MSVISSKNKVFFISRSYPPEYSGGGAIVRKQTVDVLKSRGYDVTVILFTFDSSLWDGVDDIVPIEIDKRVLKLFIALEHFGVVDDYLSPWVNKALALVVPLIGKNDLIFATSGGELGCITLGVKLKKLTSARLLVNLHDPVAHTSVLGHSLPAKFHVNRDVTTYKYLSMADSIVTSSALYADELRRKIEHKRKNIHNWYFGYVGDNYKRSRDLENRERLNIVYAGNMNDLQKPQVLIESLIDKAVFNKVNLHFFGQGSNREKIENYSKQFDNVYYHGFKSQNEVHEFYIKHAHVGFISLVGEYFGPFVPSKLYDYIKFGLPVISYLPKGDASQLISLCGLGENAEKLEDIESIVSQWVENPDIYSRFQKSIIANQENWCINHTSNILIDVVKGIL